MTRFMALVLGVVLAAIGVIGLATILYLMVFQPH